MHRTEKPFPETIIITPRNRRAFEAVAEISRLMNVTEEAGLIDLGMWDHYLPGSGRRLWEVFLREKFHAAAMDIRARAPFYVLPFLDRRISRARGRLSF